MLKKALLVIATVLVVTSSVMAYDWYFNKDLYNVNVFGMQPAYDLAVIIPANCTVGWHYDGYQSRYHFHNFTNYTIASVFRILHWSYPHNDSRPNPPHPIPFLQFVHVGAAGWGRPFRILDMYWTDKYGARIPRSIVYNATTRVIYFTPAPGDDEVATVNVTLENAIAPINEDGTLITEPWANTRDITMHDLRYAVVDEPIPLDQLNNENTYLNEELLQPLGDPDYDIAANAAVNISLPPGSCSPGQYVILRWDNYASSLFDSDSTCARDWVQLLVTADSDVPADIEERGSIEPDKLLDVFATRNGWTEIRYELPGNSKANLTLYSVAGERIVTLVDEAKAAGSYTVRWDGADSKGKKVPAGIYICRLSAEGILAVEKTLRLD